MSKFQIKLQINIICVSNRAKRRQHFSFRRYSERNCRFGYHFVSGKLCINILIKPIYSSRLLFSFKVLWICRIQRAFCMKICNKPEIILYKLEYKIKTLSIALATSLKIYAASNLLCPGLSKTSILGTNKKKVLLKMAAE